MKKTTGNPKKSAVKDQLPVHRDQMMSGQKSASHNRDAEVRANTRDSVLKGNVQSLNSGMFVTSGDRNTQNGGTWKDGKHVPANKAKVEEGTKGKRKGDFGNKKSAGFSKTF